jgi:hypothetical protein
MQATRATPPPLVASMLPIVLLLALGFIAVERLWPANDLPR